MASPKVYEAFGQTHTVFDWSLNPRCKVSLDLLRQRIKSGWSMERALTKPKRISVDDKTRREVARLFSEGVTGRDIAKRLGFGHSTAYYIRGKQP